MSTDRPGTLYLVVGPSGAGKDALLSKAQEMLTATHVFPKRIITRPADAGGEDHRAVTRETFASLRAAGGLALHWEAHGLLYGIDAEVEAILGTGRHVVCNVSRKVVEEARQRFRCIVVEITASADVRAARLRSRGREPEADIAGRLRRAVDVAPDVTVVNDGLLETAQKRFVAVLAEQPLR